MLTRNTRIGYTPVWKNTFVHFQASKDSAMHVTEQISFLFLIFFLCMNFLLLRLFIYSLTFLRKISIR